MIHCPEIRTACTDPPPEETRLNIFLPLPLLRENAVLVPFFARIVQQFAEMIATITVERRDRADDLHYGGVVNDPPVPRTASEQRPVRELVPFSTIPQSSAASPNHSFRELTVDAKREIIHVSPRGMPQLKVAYASDDPWRLEDALAWAEMWEAFPEPSQGEREPRAVIRALKAHIKDLESAIRTRDTAISELKDILGDDGELFLSSPPFIRLNHHSRQQDRARGFVFGDRSVLRSSTDRHQSAR